MNSTTVVQKFWQRVFDQPDDHAISVKNRHINTHVYPVVAPGYASAVVVSGPDYLPMTTRQLGYAVSALAAFLEKRGITRGANGEPGDRVAILAWNCPEWTVWDLAVASVGGVTVPIYPNNGPDQVNYVLENSGAKLVFSNDHEQLKKASVAGCEAIHFDDVPELLTGVAPKDEKLPFIENFFEEEFQNNEPLMVAASRRLMKFSAAAANMPCCGVSPSDLATIIYTSGSTGVPKGVELTHDNFAAACESMVAHGIEVFPESDNYLSYLPLAHVYERAGGESLCLWTGIPMSYEGNPKKAKEVLPIVRPTVFHGVPAVWRAVQDTIMGMATGLKGKIMNWALTVEKTDKFKFFFADLLVFRKIRNAFGGRMRIGTSGGAPLSKESVLFFDKAGIEILQGYGLTETTGAVTVNRPSIPGQKGPRNKAGTVGPVIDGDGTEIRIAPIPGQPDTIGEIQIKGRKVMRGYWKLPAETKKSFTEDGWFRSGDLGYFDSDKFLVITGRLKRLLKTDGGKYVAPEKIEKAFEGNPIVQGIVPVGDGMPFISGLVFLNMPIALNLVSSAGISVEPGDVPAFLARQQVVLDAVKTAVEKANGKLEHWETLKKWAIVPVEATVEGGLLTPTQKVRTEEVLKRYKNVIDAFYRK